MKCVAITPEKTVFDQEVKFVVVPLYDGEYGVGANHSPVVGRLGVGELRLTLADKSMEHWYVEGGFVEVAKQRRHSFNESSVQTPNTGSS